VYEAQSYVPPRRQNVIDQQEISFKGFAVNIVKLRVIGTTSYISNRLSDDARKKIRDKQQGKKTGGRPPKDPEAEFRGSLYVNPLTGNYCHPAGAFKEAAVAACRQDDSKGFTMVKMWGAFHVMGEYVDIEDCAGGYYGPGGKEPTMREDNVRVPPRTGAADLRYRGDYWPWAATLTIRYNPNAVSVEQIAYLLDLAGFAVGVGGWRPEKHGNHGMFMLDTGGDDE
jgi:hypothetical protein